MHIGCVVCNVCAACVQGVCAACVQGVCAACVQGVCAAGPASCSLGTACGNRLFPHRLRSLELQGAVCAGFQIAGCRL